MQAISFTLMICQHSLSVLFPKQILSSITNFLFLLSVRENLRFSTIIISQACAVTLYREVLTRGQVEEKSEFLQGQIDGKGLLIGSQKKKEF